MVTVSSCEHLASRSDSSSEHLCADATAESARVTADDLIFVHPSQKDAETGPIVVVEIDSNEVVQEWKPSDSEPHLQPDARTHTWYNHCSLALGRHGCYGTESPASPSDAR